MEEMKMTDLYSGNHVKKKVGFFLVKTDIIINVKNSEVGLTLHDDETSCCGLPMSRQTGVLRLEGMRV